MLGRACVVQVAWLDHKSIPLTYEDRRVVDDFRFSVVRPYIKEWNLQIRDIKWDDQGQYRCTINTDPVKSKIVMLHVKGESSSQQFLSSIISKALISAITYRTTRARVNATRFYKNSMNPRHACIHGINA